MKNGSFALIGQKTSNAGFTYVGVLVVLSIMMIAMGAVTEVWHSQMQRENEQELLFVGNQFRNAIGRYYRESGSGYPVSLEVLLGADNNSNLTRHYLRKIYRDPITGKPEWGLLLGSDGKVAGVRSLSDMKPYKMSGFSDDNITFEGKTKYSDWRFIFVAQNAQANSQGATSQTATSGAAPAGSIVNGIARPTPRFR